MRQHLRHTINFSDETTPTRRAKPAGVIGVSNLRVAWSIPTADRIRPEGART